MLGCRVLVTYLSICISIAPGHACVLCYYFDCRLAVTLTAVSVIGLYRPHPYGYHPYCGWTIVLWSYPWTRKLFMDSYLHHPHCHRRSSSASPSSSLLPSLH